MKILRAHSPGFWLIPVVSCLFVAGCASTNVNPPSPKSHSGYVDLYLTPPDELCWDVQRVGAGGELKKVFSDLDPIAGPILRLAFAPGHYRLRITFLDRVIAEPAMVDVDVQDGSLTPVAVMLEDAGAAAVRSKDTSYGGTAYGRYGRRTRIRHDESTVYRVKATAKPVRPYQPKEQMEYSK